MKRILSAVVTIFCFSLTLPAFAAHPLATDDAGTNGKMKFQVETSAEFAWDKQDNTKSNSQTINLAVSAGLLDSLDLSLAYPYTWQQEKDNGVTVIDNSGLNDLSMALKWRFLELGPASFAIKPAITFPTGNYDRGLGAGRPAYGVTLISTVEFKPVAIHANVGYTLQKYNDADKDAGREDLWNLSLAGAVEVMKGLQLVAEIGAASNADMAGRVWPVFIAGGVIYSAFDYMDLSLGVKGALNAPETDIALLTGLTFKFP
ncbi:MAG: transporter [Desulfuromonadaceae bacterium]|nr:transporter [Desulfuromonadaceae bacterium]